MAKVEIISDDVAVNGKPWKKGTVAEVDNDFMSRLIKDGYGKLYEEPKFEAPKSNAEIKLTKKQK